MLDFALKFKMHYASHHLSKKFYTEDGAWIRTSAKLCHMHVTLTSMVDLKRKENLHGSAKIANLDS